MAINFTVPEVSSSLHLVYLYHIFVHLQFILLNILPLFFLFVPIFTPNTIRICPTKLPSLPINHIFNVLVR